MPIVIAVLTTQYENISFPSLALIHFCIMLFGAIINATFPRRSEVLYIAAKPHEHHGHEEHGGHKKEAEHGHGEEKTEVTIKTNLY